MITPFGLYPYMDQPGGGSGCACGGEAAPEIPWALIFGGTALALALFAVFRRKA